MNRVIEPFQERRMHRQCAGLHLWRWLYQRELALAVREVWRAVKTYWRK